MAFDDDIYKGEGSNNGSAKQPFNGHAIQD